MTPLAPVVTNKSPASGATNVPLDVDVVAIFSKPMDPATMTGANFSITDGVSPVSGTVGYVGGTLTSRPTIRSCIRRPTPRPSRPA